MCVQTQHSSLEAFSFFGSNPLIPKRSLLDLLCSYDANACLENSPKFGIIFFLMHTVTHYLTTPITLVVLPLTLLSWYTIDSLFTAPPTSYCFTLILADYSNLNFEPANSNNHWYVVSRSVQ